MRFVNKFDDMPEGVKWLTCAFIGQIVLLLMAIVIIAQILQ
jgi:hypothetical protein